MGEKGFESPPAGTEIWGVEFGRLATRIQFESYSDAVEFANSVFELVEDEDFHPEVTVREGEVDIDIEKSSGKGVAVAEKIEGLLEKRADMK